MGMKGKMIVSLEVKCGGHSVYDIFHTNTHHLPNISPSRVKHFEIHEGEIGKIGSVVSLKYYEGINLPLKDAFHSDPYVVVTMGDQKVKTSCKKNNCNPVWDDELTLALKNPNVQIVLTVYDKDTFSKDDKIGEVKIDIKPYLKVLEMSYHQDLPNSVKVDKVQPNRDNCLAKESCIIWENGKLIQDMTLMLQNVECGEVKLQIEVIPKMLSEDAFYIA
ncbi:hypothetical protein KY285_019291 [Solanum tuberosum]|nr:hypothetical protein KY285_019291 [Solanum tuberosum]